MTQKMQRQIRYN